LDILFANPFFHPYYGGTEKVLYQIGRRLARKHSITVLTARIDGTSEREELEGMEIVRLPSKIFYSAPHPFPPPVPFISGLPEWLESNASRFDIVHVNNRFVFPPGFGSIAKRRGSKLSLTIHNARPAGIDFLSDLFGALYDDLFAKRLMRLCDGISGVSTSALFDTIPHDYRGVKRTIYNGIDEKQFTPGRSEVWKEALGIEGKMILTNARLIQQKGLGYLIEAMKDVDADLVVFGRGPLHRLLEAKARLLRARVHFVTQRLEEDELPLLYKSADLFVMPSLYDPCPVALLEGMSSGLPAVVTAVGGQKELIQSGRNGLVVPPRDPGSLSSAINTLLGDRKLAAKFGKENRKRIIENHTWDKIAKEYEKFFSEL
jgi:glycosyltransferase involved in cell wall biosynthesis